MPSIGLIGRLVAILLIAIVLEFATSTLLYERASRLSDREGNAHRVAEHLTVARHSLVQSPASDRPSLAAKLSDERLQLAWQPGPPKLSGVTPKMDETRRQMIYWEPELATARLLLHLPPAGRQGRVFGALRLPDNSWLTFTTSYLVQGSRFALDRIALALVPVAMLILIGTLLVRQTLKPMRLLANAADRIGHGEMRELRETGSNEVRQVMRAFNGMQQRIRQLIDGRTEALAGVGHDLRTPLTRLQLRAEDIADPQLRDAIGTDIAEMKDMVESLLAYFGGDDDPEQPARTDVAVLAATLVDAAMDRGLAAEYAGPDHLEITARAGSLKRALGNLLDNALYYGGEARLSLEEAADRIIFRVEDNGPGIPEAALKDVIQAFTRLDPARGRNTSGLGLGLTIVARMVEREGGTLTLANRAEGGLSATITLFKPKTSRGPGPGASGNQLLDRPRRT